MILKFILSIIEGWREQKKIERARAILASPEDWRRTGQAWGKIHFDLWRSSETSLRDGTFNEALGAFLVLAYMDQQGWFQPLPVDDRNPLGKEEYRLNALAYDTSSVLKAAKTANSLRLGLEDVRERYDQALDIFSEVLEPFSPPVSPDIAWRQIEARLNGFTASGTKWQPSRWKKRT